ncbi:ornithine--acyl-ACP N-acyltransferase OlsB, partial [Rhizobium ruizarguesonis]
STAAVQKCGDILGRIGNLETRLARTACEIDAAQAVRYRVFFDEMKAQLPLDAMRLQRDILTQQPVGADDMVFRVALDRAVENE